MCKIPAPLGVKGARFTLIWKRIVGNTVYTTNFYRYGRVAVRFRAVHQFCGDKVVGAMVFFKFKPGQRAAFNLP